MAKTAIIKNVVENLLRNNDFKKVVNNLLSLGLHMDNTELCEVNSAIIFDNSTIYNDPPKYLEILILGGLLYYSQDVEFNSENKCIGKYELEYDIDEFFISSLCDTIIEKEVIGTEYERILDNTKMLGLYYNKPGWSTCLPSCIFKQYAETVLLDIYHHRTMDRENILNLPLDDNAKSALLTSFDQCCIDVYD